MKSWNMIAHLEALKFKDFQCAKMKVLWKSFQPFLCQNVHESSDPAYAKLLNRVHYGILMPKDANILKSRFIDIASNDVSEAFHRYPTRKQVQDYNSVTQNELSIDENDRLAENLPNYIELSWWCNCWKSYLYSWSWSYRQSALVVQTYI